MAKKIGIAGELESKTTEGKLADASQIKDSSRENKSQKEINDEFQSEIESNAADIQRLYRGTGIEEYSQFGEGNAYAVGTIVLYDGAPYKFVAEHVQGTAWDWNEVVAWSEKKEREEKVGELAAEINNEIENLSKELFIYTTLKGTRYAAHSIDSSTKEIVSNPNNDIFYYPISKGDEIKVTATHTEVKSFRIAFSETIPEEGVVVDLRYDSRPTSVNETYISEIDGYLVINHTATYFIDTKVVKIEQFSKRVENNETNIQSLEESVGRKMLESANDLDISDEEGNIILSIRNGHVRTKHFNSKSLAESLTLTETLSEKGKAISVDGSIIDSGIDSEVRTYNTFDREKLYRIDGYCPNRSKRQLLIAYYRNDVFISGEMPSRGSKNDSSVGNGFSVRDYQIHIPEDADTIKVYGQQTDIPTIHIEDATADNVQQYNLNRCPQIAPTPIIRKTNEERLKVLCFGSSWFMDTWWYLNKITKSAGIDAEFYCFYVGGTQFAEWLDKYKNDGTAQCFHSVDGSDWTNSNLGFKTILSQGDWDIIAFQQGARQAIYWELYWEPYWSDLVSIVKRHCTVNTAVVFNATWTPAIYESGMSRTEELWPASNTADGQKEWQAMNNRNTQRFSLLSGITNIVPNGATMWALRRDSELNVSKDLASDGLHPDNGLPLYATAGTFFQTVIAPMYGIDFDNVDWLPDSTTQKASVSGNYFQPISESQRNKVRAVIKLAISDRFGFRTLNE